MHMEDKWGYRLVGILYGHILIGAEVYSRPSRLLRNHIGLLIVLPLVGSL
jgi:hypothetical protein